MRALAALLLATLPCAALAQESGASTAAESTIHRHLGFFFRATAGLGYLSSSSSWSDGPQPPVSGVSVPLGLAVGGAVAEDWILAGEVWGGFSLKTADGLSRTLFVYGYAVAVTHYFLPVNVYLSLSPGITRLTFERGNAAISTDYGPGVKVAVGKE